jgi:hypothetical protein
VGLGIAVIALVLRLRWVGYGLLYELDPNERDFVDAAWGMVERSDLNPGSYGPAATLIDILAVFSPMSLTC